MSLPWREVVRNVGLFPPQWRRLRRLPRFMRDYKEFRRRCTRKTLRPHGSKVWPILDEYSLPAGIASVGYFHQDLWAARKVHATGVEEHTDVGSLLEGFVGHVLSFAKVNYVDIRPLPLAIPGLHFIQADASHLDVFENNSQRSLSSLHAAEHFGLGRYGDPIDPDACFSFMRALQRVLAIGGHLYFSTPIGRERTEFNAHRVFAPRTILETFDRLQLASFSAVTLEGNFVEDCNPHDFEGGCMATGLFEFIKAQ